MTRRYRSSEGDTAPSQPDRGHSRHAVQVGDHIAVEGSASSRGDSATRRVRSPTTSMIMSHGVPGGGCDRSIPNEADPGRRAGGWQLP